MTFNPLLLFKKILPKSLLGRSLIILITPLIVVQVVLSYLFFDRHTEAILHLLAKSIVADVQTIAQLTSDNLPIEKVQEIAQNFEFDLQFQKEAKMPRHGADKDRWLYQFMTDALDENLKFLYFLRIDNHNIYIDVAHPAGVLHITTPRKRLYSRTTPLVIIWTTISAALLLIISSIFMRNQLKPIIRLANASENFGKGIDNGPIPAEGATEVRRAGKAYNVMRERINRQLKERMEMLAGVSHDLRTPLTRMKLQLALMSPTEEVVDLQEDVESMRLMVQGFLDFARGSEHEATQLVELKSFLEDIIDDLSHLKIKIHLSSPEAIKINLRKLSFNRCLTNLLLNSDRYGTEASVAVELQDKNILIYVDDNGPGISDKEIANVFKPFYRVDESRNAETGGVGLGLSIARDVILSHGGALTLGKSPSGGLRVVIKIPF
ncbi:ATP-binding protein [Candidatus Paracaedibacter symbiosus]|uniref:ATP-binding protein n=1 Tax=Candidatus Paracaedibacter symbiosus TaxID=244582 RepID=UPI000509B059|nr:ATP-binding protein [Candidatus Paracaedibacter symbiosus]